jgi:hypothetical protein
VKYSKVKELYRYWHELFYDPTIERMAIRNIVRLEAQVEQAPCQWKRHVGCDQWLFLEWQTGCGDIWVDDGKFTPTRFKFCPECGHPLVFDDTIPSEYFG